MSAGFPLDEAMLERLSTGAVADPETGQVFLGMLLAQDGWTVSDAVRALVDEVRTLRSALGQAAWSE